jgi:Disulphide bond corrector protein DsbC
MTLFIRHQLLLGCLFCSHLSFGQNSQYVQWRFKAEYNNPQEAILTFTASVQSGWHLYSQYLKEGGPLPTHFVFEPNENFVCVGEVEEKGEQTTFYDKTYDMEITWYSGVVNFIQKARLHQPATKIFGKIEYMICSNHVCIPNKQDFYFDLNPSVKKP